MATPSAAQHRDLEERFRKIEAAVRAVAAAVARRPKFEVSAGDLTIRGGDLVVDGGDFLLLDTDGSTVFRLGPQQHGDRGVTLSRENGTEALSVSKTFAESDQQELRMRDRHGSIIFGEEALGSGMARPWLPIPMLPVMATPGPLQCGPWGPEVPVTSGTFTTTHQAWYARHNQFGSFKVRVAASDATTAAEVRVVDGNTGDALGEFLVGAWTGTRAAGSTGYVEVASPGSGLFLPGDPWERVSVAVQVRRTAGTGTLAVAVPEARGGSSAGE